MKPILALLAALALAGCARDSGLEERNRFHLWLNNMIGLKEVDLVVAMRHIPDSTYQAAPQTKFMLWRIESTITTPGKLPEYVWHRGQMLEIGGAPARQESAACTVQWMVLDGTAQSFTARGRGCP